MNLSPTQFSFPKVAITFFSILLFLFSCSRDTDLLLDSVLEESIEEVVTLDNTTEEVIAEEVVEEVVEEEEIEPELVLESRTSLFPSLQDAHMQSGKGFNQEIVRLEEGNRTSYLMFDLSPIAEIEATITAVELQFTIVSDSGDGAIKVFKGDSNEWSELSLTTSTIPESEVLLGSITKEYKIGAIEKISLNTANIDAQIKTLVLSHENGDDLSFASKEHASVDGPRLVVTYDTPPDSPEIIIEEPEEAPITEAGNEAPIAIADASPKSGQFPLLVNFNGSNSTDDTGIETYTWKIKDGVTKTNANPSYTFEEVGSYAVELTVTDAEGLTAIDIVTITVTEEENQKPTAIGSATPLSGEAPLKVDFKGDKSEDDMNIASFRWRFAEGETSNEVNPSFTFTEPGTYPIVLTVKDENGLEDQANLTITVIEPENTAPKAIVSANVTSGAIPLTVNFTGNKSTDDKDVTGYTWNFKDGATSSNANPQHIFKSAGTYLVELTVKDAEGLSHKKTITITATETNNAGPRANGSANVYSGEAPLTVQFSGDKSTDDKEVTGYTWDFKDGSSSTIANPSHTFENPGTYRVQLTVIDADGATDNDIDTITVSESSVGNGGGGSNGNYPNGVKASTFGYNANNATDAFKAAIKSSHSVIIIDKQNSDWIIEPSKFFDIANKTIVFEPGVILRAKSGAFSSSTAVLFNFVDGRDITIEGYGATLKMNRNEYGSSEFRHALKIGGCTNVTVKGLRIIDSGGDGINIQRGGGQYSQNVTIEDVVSHNNSRQGLSIISGKDIYIKNSTFSGTNGKAPEAGIDLEPNFVTDRLQNINITNCTFENNNFAGIMLAPFKLDSSSIPLSIKVSDCTFKNNSQNANHSQVTTEIRLGTSESSNPVQGSVEFTRLTFNGALGKIIYSPKPSNAYSVLFKDCVGKNLLSSRNEYPILLQGRLDTQDIGGFTFDNFRLEYDRNQPFLRIRNPPDKKIKNISGSFTIVSPNDNGIEYDNGTTSSDLINVNINYNHINN